LVAEMAAYHAIGATVRYMYDEIAKQIIIETGKPFLIVCPLGVAGEFKRDNIKVNNC